MAAPIVPELRDGVNKQSSPLRGFGCREAPGLRVKPAGRIGQRLSEGVQFENEFAHGNIRAATEATNQVARGDCVGIAAGVVLLEQCVERGALQRARLRFIEHGELRIESEFGKMFAHELQAETVQRANGRGVQQGELLGEPFIVGLGGLTFEQFRPQPTAHFGSGGFGERDHQQGFHRDAFVEDQTQRARDERVGFARARAGDEQQITRALNRGRLLPRETTHGAASDFAELLRGGGRN